MGLMIDSSVLIAKERGKLDWSAFVKKWAGESLFMASITLSELWHGWHIVCARFFKCFSANKPYARPAFSSHVSAISA